MSSPPYTIIGTPFSTFTRSITLALHYKGLAFNQVRVTPHSDTAYENHPFGFLPTLVIPEIDGKTVNLKLRETQAIARYIDRVAPEPSLLISGGDAHALIEEQMWEFVSFAGAHGFPAVEKGVVKPRVAATDEGKLTDAQIRQNIQDGVAHLRKFLARAENAMAPEGYVFGEKLSWADFFLYPLLADLQAISEGEELSDRFQKWMKKMGELDAVKATAAGTLSVGARPP
ncbi:hypothetical protein HYDPIDRAFT_91171 [Hydnomerulius pinastri MD-312]|uniref:Glutathione transferase n=1 Tax=Hydnomerulius pinastri MD-312 TaxID=994086 RepID=A0A0C9VEU0_9AGAM|nr:hypothetical protein HYDPIDRAFT_91171 [Hydnomerulius pinastri MD-312]